MTFFNPMSLLTGDYLAMLQSGLRTTISLFFTTLLSGFVLASILTVLRATGVRLLDWGIAAFVEYHRNVPGLVQLFVWYFGIAQFVPYEAGQWINRHGSEYFFAYIALTLNTAAYMSEDLRSGLRTVAGSQLETARSLGLNYYKAMRFVVMPQALRAAVPPLISQAVSLFKSTSLAMAIGVGELTYMTRRIESETFKTFEAFAIVSVIYVAGSMLIQLLGFLWNLRLQRRSFRHA